MDVERGGGASFLVKVVPERPEMPERLERQWVSPSEHSLTSSSKNLRSQDQMHRVPLSHGGVLKRERHNLAHFNC